MFGRLAGLAAGLVILASGFGLWKPAVAARYEHVVDFARVPLGDFGQYRTIVALLIMVVGVVVGVAALQRETDRKSSRPKLMLMEDEPAHGAADHDTGHGHGDHGHDDHGHDSHGHDSHGHDDHAHDDHAHDDHGHDDHGHDDHGHGHGEREHAPAHH
jgi:hypothetical protein